MNRLIKHMKYLLIIFPLSLFNYVSAYTMPTGIPEAGLDFTQEMPARPSSWDTEIAGYYYINYQTGSDKQTYGTPDAPRKSIPNPASAGSYIEIAGEYTQGFTKKSNRMYTFNGTDDAWNAGVAGPVWLTEAKDTNGSIKYVGFLMTGSNVFISDLNFTDGAKIQVGSPTEGYPAENIVVRNVDISGGGFAVSGSKLDTTRANNVILFNSKLHDFGDINSETDDDNTLMMVTAGASNVWLLNNELYNASGGGLQVLGHSERGTTSNIYAGGNEIYNVRQGGLWVKYGSNVVFSNNRIHDIISTPWSPSKGMGAQYGPDNLWMINNHISGVEYGIRIASTSSVTWDKKIYIIGNVIHNVRPIQAGATVGPIESTSSWQSAAIHIASSDEQYIFNNLIFDAPNGIDVSTQNATTWIKNNILLDVTASHIDEDSGYHIMLEYLALDEQAFIDNNYFGDGMYVRVKEGVSKKFHETVSSLNSREGASGNVQGTNIITQNNIDSIMDAMSIDGLGFTQLKDVGVNVNDILITRFKLQFPDTNGINSDILGKQRNLGSSIDIGPFEQDGAEVNTTDPIISTIPEKPGEVTIIQVP